MTMLLLGSTGTGSHCTSLFWCYRKTLLVLVLVLTLGSSEGADTAIGLGAGLAHSCAIRASHSSLVCFGDNFHNQLGYGIDVAR
jgi:hypothetical protein